MMATESLLTIRDFIRWGASRFNEAELFFGHGTDNALDEAVTLVLHALHLGQDLPPLYLEARLTADERKEVSLLIQRRVDERVPAAYLTNEAWFSGTPFYVDERVLVPRSPIAELLEVGFQPWIDEERLHRVLDLCTGSGCIGIAAALHSPWIEVDLVDISQDALQVANRNIKKHQLIDQVRAIHSDLFSALKGERYDIIVSNPPYVNLDEMNSLADEYQAEPRLGLVAEEHGLLIVNKILSEAARHLNPHGVLIVEVGSSAEAVLERYPTTPFVWLDFERGGDGVFLLTAEQLAEFNEQSKH
jgi:ribosomal protein L3 glutamine methyltransferase